MGLVYLWKHITLVKVKYLKDCDHILLPEWKNKVIKDINILNKQKLLKLNLY